MLPAAFVQCALLRAASKDQLDTGDQGRAEVRRGELYQPAALSTLANCSMEAARLGMMTPRSLVSGAYRGRFAVQPISAAGTNRIRLAGRPTASARLTAN